ncbi:MAG: hypothetical protein Q8O33_17410 [Pseudomonadota bacterium]|nr:hypothetical protein [Pseudomonadota bacterium]
MTITGAGHGVDLAIHIFMFEFAGLFQVEVILGGAERFCGGKAHDDFQINGGEAMLA